MPFRFVKVPKDFECSITHEMMVDPIFTADGETYDRDAIIEWLSKHDTSPNTNEKLAHKNLIINRKLKSQISEFVEQNRKTFEQELMEAAKQGDSETVKLVLKLGINVNAEDTNGWTALHYAADNNHIAIANLLFDNKCNVDKDSASLKFLPSAHSLNVKKIEELLKKKSELVEKLLRNDLKKEIRLYDKLDNEIKVIKAKEKIKLRLVKLNEFLQGPHDYRNGSNKVSYDYGNGVFTWNNNDYEPYQLRYLLCLEYANACNSWKLQNLERLRNEVKQNYPDAREKLERLYGDYSRAMLESCV